MKVVPLSSYPLSVSTFLRLLGGFGLVSGGPRIFAGILGTAVAVVACSSDDDPIQGDEFVSSGGSPAGGGDAIGGMGGGGAGSVDSPGTGGDGDTGSPLTPSMGPCRDVVCGLGQECMVSPATDTAMCRCKIGFWGPNCEDVNECLDGQPCHPQAECINYPGGFFCECQAGHAGTGQLCENVNECQLGSDSCDDDANCSDSDGTFSCSCGAGETGDGLLCQSTDACSGSPCANGECLSTEGAFVCACEPGFAGTSCDQTCGDLNLADANLEQAVQGIAGPWTG